MNEYNGKDPIRFKIIIPISKIWRWVKQRRKKDGFKHNSNRHNRKRDKYPSDSASDIIVDGDYVGTVTLQCSRPGAGVWHTVLIFGRTETRGATPIMTPSALDYRFLPDITSGTANVYMGP